MKKSFFFILIILVGLGLQSIALPKEKGWIKLGEKFVSFKADKDNIIISGNERNISKFKITCIQGVVKIKKIHVKMSDGMEKEYNPAAGVLKEGMSTITFDLPGKDNKLKDFEIEYDSMGTIATNKRAKVEIWGKKLEE